MPAPIPIATVLTTGGDDAVLTYLKAAREHHSQTKIARHLKVDARTIRRWETRPLHTATALSPTRSAVIEACAGSGKTWLLVSRMLRLLLAGAEPCSGILNAAADMVHPFQPMIFLPGITGDHSWKQHP